MTDYDPEFPEEHDSQKPAGAAGSPEADADDATLMPLPELERAMREASREVVGEVPRVSSRYELLEKIGQGTFGDVWRAKQLSTDHDVALKLFSRKRLGDFESLRREIDRLGKITEHPYIMTLIDADIEGEYPYYVMPVLPRSLQRVIDQTDYASADSRMKHFIRQAQTWLRQAAEALSYMHAKGIFHCDLKPANILIDDNHNVRIADFGQSQLTGERSSSLGTLWFMPPEQAEFDPSRAIVPDARWDVYGIGACMYHLVTGQRPHGTEANLETLTSLSGQTGEILEVYREMLARTPLARVRDLNPHVSADLASILEKCLECDPKRRYQNTTGIIDDLENMHARRPLSSRPRTITYTMECFIRRNKTLVAAALVVAFISLFSLFNIIQSRNEAVAASRAERAARAREEREKDKYRAQLAYSRFIRGVEEAETTGVWDSGLPWFAQAVTLGQDHVPYALAALQALGGARLSNVIDAGDNVHDVTLSSDGKLAILSCGEHGSAGGGAQVINLESGAPVTRRIEHQSVVVTAVFSPDGEYGASIEDRGVALVWDAHTGKLASPPIACKESLGLGSFSLDSRQFVTVSGAALDEDLIVRLDINTGELTKQALDPFKGMTTATFSPDGSRLAAADPSGAVVVWDVNQARIISPEMRHQEMITCLEFSSDGQSIVASSLDGESRVWRRDGSPVSPVVKFERESYGSAFSPDGKTVVTVLADQTAVLWDAASGAAIGKPLEHQDAIVSAVFSPDGKWVLTASKDATARIWNAQTGQPVSRPLPSGHAVHAARFSPDGKKALTCSVDRTVRMWDLSGLTPDRLQLPHGGGVTRVEFSPSGDMLLSVAADHAARLWDPTSGRLLSPPLVHDDAIAHAAFHPQGNILATASGDGSIRLWDTKKGTPALPRIETGSAVNALCFRPDGKVFVTAQNDGTVQLFDSQTGRRVGKVFRHDQEVNCAVFSPDGREILTASYDCFRIWEAVTGRPLLDPVQHSAGWAITMAQFSPDGKRLVTASTDTTARVWDSRTGQPLCEPLRHQGYVHTAYFSSSSERVLSASFDGTARVWSAETGEPVSKPMRHAASVQQAIFSPDDQFILTASLDGAARLWDAATGDPLSPFFRTGMEVYSVAFHPRGARIAVSSGNWQSERGDVYIRQLPGIHGISAERLGLKARVHTGGYLDQTGTFRVWGTEEWKRQNRELLSPTP